MTPRISIVLPVKDRPHLLPETVASLLAQTEERWEAIWVDDQSDGPTRQYLATLPALDPRFSVVTCPDDRSGAPACRNIGFAASAAELVIFLDSDDLLVPQCLQNRIRGMDGSPDLEAAVYAIENFLDVPGDMGTYWNCFTAEDDIDRFLRLDTPWGTHAVIWRRAALERVGLWDEQVIGWQDPEFHIRALAMGLRYVKVPVADCYYRTPRPGSLSFEQPRLYRVRAMAPVLAKTAATLRRHNALTPARRAYLLGAFVRYVRQAADEHRSAGAGWFIWRQARAALGVPWWRWWPAAVLFALGTCVSPLRRRACGVMLRGFPESKLVACSTTLGCARVIAEPAAARAPIASAVET